VSRQRSDIYESGLGPLFAPPVEHLSGRTDPETSRKAAAAVLPRLGWHQRLALAIVGAHPGSTCKELAAAAMDSAAGQDFGPGDLEAVRQRIGRRLNELEKAGLIYRDGERDGCSLWWPK
jgi:hypothetical protein